jgi:hypothetical protein
VVERVANYGSNLFLRPATAKRGAGLLPRCRENGHVIQPRVVETGDQMRRAGPRGDDVHAQFARELRMRGGHEGGHFFVTGLKEFDRGAGFVSFFFSAACARPSAPKTPLMPSPG